MTGLRLSPDGTWLAATVQQPDPEGKKFSTSIWRIPVGGRGGQRPPGPAPEPSRLTQSARGEDNPAFLPDGSLLFASKRPDPAAGSADRKAGEEDGAKSALWLLPVAGGEARRIAAPPGGVSGIVTARAAPGQPSRAAGAPALLDRLLGSTPVPNPKAVGLDELEAEIARYRAEMR